MDLVTGAMGSLLPKLGKLLNEYKLQKGVKEDIKSLEKEMKIMRAALHKVAEVPRDQLEEGIKIWAGELRELSYNIEDVVDKFLVHVNGESSDPNSNKIKQLGDNIIGLFTNWKSCHQIANEIKDIKNQVNYVAKQHKRYRVSGIVAANVAATTTTFDPRLPALYNKVSDLVGINEPRDELIKRLTNKNDQIEIVSIVGFGGLGKTTLAKAVYDSLKPQFDCTAFVSVSQTPDMVGIFRKMLHQLDKKNYAHINEASHDATELIDELRMFLRNKRLSIQNRNEDNQRKPLAFMSKSQVRSVTTFPPAINQMMSLSRFDVLRVLDLNGCHLGKSKNLNLEDVVNLFHLRYLGLAGTNICQLPAGIGNLLFLQVLDVRYNSNLKELPSSICKLRRLMCLLVNGYHASLPDGLGNLTSMEVLKKICATLNIVKELRKLSMLRELKVKFERNASLEYGEAFLESLRHLKNIQSVIIRGYFPSMDLLEKSWLPPQQLRAFESVRCGAFSGVPEWIKRDPLCLSDLAELVIGFVELREEDLLILGRLPVLRRLWLWSAKQTPKVLSIGADGFHYLTSFTLYCESPRQIVFQRGAFPKVEGVLFNFNVKKAKDDGNGDFYFGLLNLLSLGQVTVGIDRHGVTLADVKDAVVALRHTVNVHPLHPVITFDIRPLIQQEEAQRASEMNPEFFFDEELIREQRKLPGKFRKFRAETT